MWGRGCVVHCHVGNLSNLHQVPWGTDHCLLCGLEEHPGAELCSGAICLLHAPGGSGELQVTTCTVQLSLGLLNVSLEVPQLLMAYLFSRSSGRWLSRVMGAHSSWNHAANKYLRSTLVFYCCQGWGSWCCLSSWACHGGSLDKPRETGFWPCGFWHKRRCCCLRAALGHAGAVLLVTRSCANVADPKERNIRGLRGGRTTLLPCSKGRFVSPGSRVAASEERRASIWLCNGLSPLCVCVWFGTAPCSTNAVTRCCL